MTPWRVATWNLLGSQGVLTERCAEVLEQLRPDVVCLQEVQRAQARQLAKRLGWRHVWTVKHYPKGPLVWWRAEGVAILSRHRLGETWHRSLSPEESKWSYRHRVALAATVSRDDSMLRAFNTHLGGSPAERVPQAERLAALMSADRSASVDTARRSASVIVAGDLNAANDPRTLRPLLEAGLIDPGGANSSTSLLPYQRIDYILVPKASRVSERTTPSGGRVWNELSDHLPVLVEFAVSLNESVVSPSESVA